jgi:outer membrane protein OmpA-like peptidoglycan-associated protein
MGGFDVFVSTRENGDWTKAKNLGWPINSPDDDLFFVLSADGSTAMMSSFRSDGLGEDDIYAVRFMPDELPVGEPLASAAGAAAPAADNHGVVLITGKVRSLHYLHGLEADIELMDLEDASLVARFRSDAATGEYMVAVPAGRDYALYIKAEGHLLQSEHVHVPEGRQGLSMGLDVELQPLESGKQVALRNLFFATASAELQPASLAEINQLKELLERNAALRLQIEGHTDSDGTAAFNQRLSEARANAVRERLIAQGVAADRLTAVGYGDTRPQAPNDSDANKALNRRTAIQVL